MTERSTTPTRTVAVIGAYGHTGRFVVAELSGRGLVPILSGRDADRLHDLGRAFPGSVVRPAALDHPAALDRVLAGADAVVNCAGPFAGTAAPVLDAALRARVPYLDVTAEVESVADVIARYDSPARDAGVAVVPAMAFFGGLGDLLATAALRDWPAADRVSLAYALSCWRPTPGTRATGRVSARRRGGDRIVYTGDRFRRRTGPAPLAEWTFPDPVGTLSVVAESTTADSATIPSHLAVPEVRTYLSAAAVDDLRSADPRPPTAVDDRGRSAQTFLVEAVVSREGSTRRAVARGQDIYAVTAPLVVEAAVRLLDAPGRTGVLAAGEAFDARDFLLSLSPEHLEVDLDPS
ncbi:saccharopine dehydrogenase family protein [Umezawaea sp.]|uniref:saccharopine dehydrogenase family protein n=1 Tax=Umezawaea sp. TaxID=1955258 RepID=UPI002ED57512